MQRVEARWSEDWLAVWIGLLVFVLALGLLAGADILGWVVTTAVWTDVAKRSRLHRRPIAGLGGVGALDRDVRGAHGRDDGRRGGARSSTSSASRSDSPPCSRSAISAGSSAARPIWPSLRRPTCRNSASAGR